MTSHEIRNPLSAMIHCTDEIIQNCQTTTDENSKDTLEAAHTIEYCAKHIRNIVGDVLSLSKLDSKLVEISPVPVRPKEVISDELKMFSGKVRADDIDMTFHEHDSMRDLEVDSLVLDPNRVRQVLVNLVTNAIKFTRLRPVRMITITLSASAEAPPTYPGGVSYVPPREPRQPVPFGGPSNHAQSTFLVVTVKDTGLGLTDEEKTLLFRKFKQASPKTESAYGGSGLGLFISRDLTELQGGGIGVMSEVGVGSTFVFFVEAKRAQAAERINTMNSLELPVRMRQDPSDLVASDGHKEPGMASGEGSNVARQPKVKTKKILVVEDNLINLKVLAKQLRKRGYEVATAIHGEEALQALRLTLAWHNEGINTPFHVVLMDVEMPVMDGITCVKEIRALESTGDLSGHLPIIAVTANVRDELTKRATQAGVDGITTKPYRVEELVAQIEQVSTCEEP